MVAYVTVLILAGALTCFSPFCGTSMVLHGIYACGFGLLIGNYGALCPCVMVDLKGLDSVGESYGMLLLFMGVSNLLSAPIGGVLYDLSAWLPINLTGRSWEWISTGSPAADLADQLILGVDVNRQPGC
ncbi:monocarboxylate transporter 9 [Plakobranchus ocellatus]|uniref:Monocarboxylate transporter 9 n=1 Tax=Plakobranchus ocellatus TaxID=259542 RepID=A0AAV3Y514_9GAST|nr:monocarboxylate transporter 9 [Plakobranchus ocellatus]